MEPRHTKGQFFTIWAIFGFALCIAMQEFVNLLSELIISVGIQMDLNPSVIKYSKTISYSLAWIAIVILLVIIIRSKGPVFSHVNYKKSRIALIIFILIGVLSHVLAEYCTRQRRGELRPYLTRHNTSMVEFFSSNQVTSIAPIALIFITIAIGFYILTREKEME
ncbi:MAG TPA: hypothetical protein PKH02_04210 [Bacteroidales bacterium]|nr:hypothetical protein [Bacteroidales bacterium]HPT11330.1 hypothetical protein [Bacteroidales bacterium]